MIMMNGNDEGELPMCVLRSLPLPSFSVNLLPWNVTKGDEVSYSVHLPRQKLVKGGVASQKIHHWRSLKSFWGESAPHFSPAITQ